MVIRSPRPTQPWEVHICAAVGARHPQIVPVLPSHAACERGLYAAIDPDLHGAGGLTNGPGQSD